MNLVLFARLLEPPVGGLIAECEPGGARLCPWRERSNPGVRVGGVKRELLFSADTISVCVALGLVGAGVDGADVDGVLVLGRDSRLTLDVMELTDSGLSTESWLCDML